jgi:hypothetical protein
MTPNLIQFGVELDRNLCMSHYFRNHFHMDVSVLPVSARSDTQEVIAKYTFNTKSYSTHRSTA